jgi:hypothetical protein
VGGNDGLLVHDLNHDGTINDGSELFGSATRDANGNRTQDGYAAMATEDSNHDGKLDEHDAHWKELQVWVDANHDGKTDAGELKSLSDVGIASIDLQAQAGTEVDQGNRLGLTSSYTSTDGSTHAVADVWFAKNVDTSKVNLGDLLVDAKQEVLPASTAEASTEHASTASAGTAGSTATDTGSSTAHVDTAATTQHAADEDAIAAAKLAAKQFDDTNGHWII